MIDIKEPSVSDAPKIASTDEIRKQLAVLRKKLINLSSRNKLLNFKFSYRSSAPPLIRVVDELPNELYKGLLAGSMTFKPLPEIKEIPRDEETDEFQQCLIKLSNTDDLYLAKLEQISNDAVGAEKKQELEFGLRDKARKILELKPIKRNENISIQDHARQEGYDPDYNLPAKLESDNPLHSDKEIQTLLFPDNLRKIEKKIYSENQLSNDQKGINIVHVAFGFIEWIEKEGSGKIFFAPLLLLPVEMSKSNNKYKITGVPDTCALNTSFREKIKRDFNVTDFPEFDNDKDRNLEEYFCEVEERIQEISESWKLKRYVVFSTFPFQKISLYEDLDPSNWTPPEKLLSHKNIAHILAGVEPTEVVDGGNSSIVDVPPIDIDLRKKHISIVFDADSSQFQAIKSVLDGKNIVIQGPPGTGKSQTIANIITALIANEKRVLFIAAKKAALDVVSSRLRGVRLGPLLLEFQSGRNVKETHENLKERLDCPLPLPGLEGNSEGYREIIDNFAKRYQEYNERLEQSSGFCDETIRYFCGAYLKMKLDFFSSMEDESEAGEFNIETKEQLERYKKYLADYSELLSTINITESISGISGLPEGQTILNDFIQNTKNICKNIKQDEHAFQNLRDLQIVRIENSRMRLFFDLLFYDVKSLANFKIARSFRTQLSEFIEYWDLSSDMYLIKKGNSKSLDEVYMWLQKISLLSVEELNNFRLKEIQRKEIAEAGLEEFYEKHNSLSPRDLKMKFEFCVRRNFYKHTFKKFGGFNAGVLANGIDGFNAADKKVIQLNASNILEKWLDKEIPKGNKGMPIGKLTDKALIEHELKKKKAHIPARQLIKRARKALFVMKPVWMMSPLAVPECLPREENQFDVVVIDEASQMVPEDALSAIVRGKQLVVVGDDKQLPPTRFFETGESTEDDEADLTAMESILDIASLRFESSMLRWHYRSISPSLISFSNEEFYNSELILLPSPEIVAADCMQYVEVSDDDYSTGLNPVEADKVVSEAVKVMSEQANKSLAIVAMNLKQSDLIREEIEQLANTNEKVEAYISKWDLKLEKFIIRNLENIQGDERDIIIISTVYGHDSETGEVRQNFGPINKEGGERRLNVLFTRAKEKIILVSSLTANDIRLRENSKKGVGVLKNYLEYAANAGKPSSGKSQGEPDSDFEVAVANSLRKCGFHVDYQIGVSGYKIDLGVEHKDYQHGYLAGVECDGATYHSSHEARDHDMIRQRIIESRGWKIFRVWSTDWFNNPEEEIRKLVADIEQHLQDKKNKLN